MRLTAEEVAAMDRLIGAIGYLPLLAETHRRLTIFVHDDLPGKML